MHNAPMVVCATGISGSLLACRLDRTGSADQGTCPPRQAALAPIRQTPRDPRNETGTYPGAQGMTARQWPDDFHISLVASIIGDYRNAPNLWLARKIVEELQRAEASGADDVTDAALQNHQTGVAPWASDRHGANQPTRGGSRA
jgi:hypothetical protein